jgi:hypothetical protein
MKKVPATKVVTTLQVSESPLPPRIQEALGELVGAAREGLLALRSNPTHVPSDITGASRNCGSTAAPLATATRANLRARRRVTLHTV